MPFRSSGDRRTLALGQVGWFACRWGEGGPRRLLRLGLLGLFFALWSEPAQLQELIVHQDILQPGLTQNEARIYFTLRLQNWPTGQRVKVFVLADDHELHRDFAKQVLGLFPYQLRSIWDRQVFSGTGQAPITVVDEAEMLKFVATTPGAIGYLRSPPADPRVRSLAVQ